MDIMSNIIKNFISIMNSNCINFTSDKLINNFKNTLFDIRKIDEEEKQNGEVSYDGKRITFIINTFNVSYHELFHLSTLDYNHSSTGFRIIYTYDDVGVGINEGFTQLLAEIYFSENIGKAYVIEGMFVSILEKIVEKDEMESVI